MKTQVGEKNMFLSYIFVILCIHQTDYWGVRTYTAKLRSDLIQIEVFVSTLNKSKGVLFNSFLSRLVHVVLGQVGSMFALTTLMFDTSYYGLLAPKMNFREVVNSWTVGLYCTICILICVKIRWQFRISV